MSAFLANTISVMALLSVASWIIKSSRQEGQPTRSSSKAGMTAGASG